jgi:hypothetical protein
MEVLIVTATLSAVGLLAAKLHFQIKRFRNEVLRNATSNE